MQEAEFAVVGIGIALLRSHALKAAFALNRSGDFAGAGREILLLPECRFELSAADSCFSLAENEPLQPAAFLRRVSGLLCAHRKGAVCTSPWLHAECTTTTSEYYVSAFISSHNSFQSGYPLQHICFQRGKDWKGKPSLIRHLEVRGATAVVLSGRRFQKVRSYPLWIAEKKTPTRR